MGGIMGDLTGLVMGYIQHDLAKGSAEKSLREFNAAFQNVDPNQVKFKDQLFRERKMIQSGFSTDFKVARDIIGQSEAGGMSVVSDLAKTNPALALMTMNQVSNQSDLSVNKALGTIASQSMGYTQMISDLIDKMAQRKIGVDLLKAEQKLATDTAIQKDFNENVMGAIGEFVGATGSNGNSSNSNSNNSSGSMNGVGNIPGLDSLFGILFGNMGGGGGGTSGGGSGGIPVTDAFV